MDADLFAGVVRGSGAGSRLGARIRRHGDPAGGGRMGRARRDPVADHPRGRQGRALHARTCSPRWRAKPPAWACRRYSRKCSGVTPESRCPSWPPGLPRPHWPPTAPRSRSANGCRRCSAARAIPSWPRSVPPNPAPALTSERSAPERSTTKPPMSGSSTAPRRGRPTAESPTCMWWWRRWSPSWAPAGRRRSSCRPTPRASIRGRNSRSTVSGRRTPPRWCSTTSTSPVS